MFKKVFVIFWFSFCLALITVLVMGGGVVVVEVAEARKGCCSAHGGVCGCECCDSTRLSAVCGQYYPECGVMGDSFEYDRTEMKPSKDATNGDDRHRLSRGDEDGGLSDGWEVAVVQLLACVWFCFLVE